jgi:penicillin V acylase-like amidase (Ntn superfamily)
MCTAATYKTKDFYFGRTLDYEFSYGDEITITPRNYPFHFRHSDKAPDSHYAIIGMAHVAGDYPLYYDAINEKGLGMAGLNFVGNAVYAEPVSDKENVAQFEFIPWILSQCATLKEARQRLSTMNLTNTQFSENFPCAQLHWILADASGCLVIESMQDGFHIYENPVGVLTNNPPFPQQMFQLNNYQSLSPTREHLRSRIRTPILQPRYGRPRPPGRPFLRLPLCQSCLHKNELQVRRLRTRKRQPVLPHPRLRRSAAWLLRSSKRQI